MRGVFILNMHLVDLDVSAVVLDLNLGHRCSLFLFYFDRFDALLRDGSSKCEPGNKMCAE